MEKRGRTRPSRHDKLSPGATARCRRCGRWQDQVPGLNPNFWYVFQTLEPGDAEVHLCNDCAEKLVRRGHNIFSEAGLAWLRATWPARGRHPAARAAAAAGPPSLEGPPVEEAALELGRRILARDRGSFEKLKDR